MTTPKKPLRSHDFERMAEELDRIAKHIRERPGSNHHFAQRIEKLAKDMRQESARPTPPRAVRDDNGKT